MLGSWEKSGLKPNYKVMGKELLEIEIEPGFLKNPRLEAEPGRELKPEDLVLAETVPLGIEPPGLKRLRAVHHQAARLLATGMKAVEVSAVVGLCQSRLSILQSDPAFRDLLAFYAEREDARMADAQERLVLLGLDAAAELHERITENPEDVSSKTLVDVMTAAFDRSGHSPVHKHSFSFLSKEDIEKIKEISPVANIRSRHETQKALSDNPESPLGVIDIEPPSSNQAQEADRGQGQGGSV